MFQTLIFYGCSFFLIMAALFVVTSKNPVYSVLALILCFVMTSGLWLLLYSEFLAIALILVYIGSVMVLFLFVVMMFSIEIVPSRIWEVCCYGAGALLFFLLLVSFYQSSFFQQPISSVFCQWCQSSQTKQIGYLMFTRYVYVFELAAILLTISVICAITLIAKTLKVRNRQIVSDQVRVNPEDRLRIVKDEELRT